MLKRVVVLLLFFSNVVLAQTETGTGATTTESSTSSETLTPPTESSPMTTDTSTSPDPSPTDTSLPATTPAGTPTVGPADWRFGVLVNTSAPTFTGAGLMLQGERATFSLQAGYMPPYYRTLIGRAVAYFGNNEHMQGIVEDIFEKNQMLRGDFNYRVGENTGWHIGASFMSLTASGRVDVDEALSAATGEDYSDLRTVLDALGLEAKIDVDSDFLFTEFYAGYSWVVHDRLYMDFSFGIMKILSTKVDIDTGLDDLEETPPIKQAIDGTEKDLADDITRNGLSPIIAIKAAYLF
ncbi:hypothetical protein ACES2L_02310 [Bdellovibrio bacteriovorus]